LLALAAVNAALPAEVETAFLNYISEHGKSYGTREEYELRLNEFHRKVTYIQKHNANPDHHRVALNFMADWTDEEYAKVRGYKKDLWKGDNVHEFGETPLDDAIDWRTKGAVTPVKNQGQCGSCWSFSATGSMEGANFLKNGSLISMSEQQLVDCSRTKGGNQGCNGGLMDLAFTYAETTQMETEAHYPYTGRDGSCSVTSKDIPLVTGFKDVKSKSPTELAAALQLGPVSIAVDGAALAFQLYFGGIVKHFCGSSLDHGVLLVGMGTERNTDYWIIKNSWGSGWGEKGYIRVERDMKKDAAGMCGLQLQPSYPQF
jgi:hypothetical protein